MEVKEFGAAEKPAVVLIHPSLVTWDYFEYVIPLLEEDYHLVVPVMPGYNLDDASEFSSVEKIASELDGWLLEHGIERLHAVYGCSMGGSIALRMAVYGKARAEHYIMDGGITPYRLPYLLTRPIALRDFLVVALGKLGGERLMAKAFSSTEFSEDDLRYAANILDYCSYRTLWRTFDSCNNYRMPKTPVRFDGEILYWYAEKERHARKWDIAYMRDLVPQTEFRELSGIDHGDMALFHPERLAQAIGNLRADCTE